MLHDTIQSLRLAARHLYKSPGFTAVAVLSLTLGIGANTAIFSLVNAVFLRPTPLEHPETVVEVYRKEDGMSAAPLSYPDVLDLRLATEGVFEGVAATGYTFAQLDHGDSVAVQWGESVSGNYFSLLGIEAHKGRLFTQEDEDTRASVVVLDYGYWQREYAGDASIVGQDIRVGGQPFSVIGVTEEDFIGNVRGLRPSVYLPIVLEDFVNPVEGFSKLESRGAGWVFAKARLSTDVTLAQVNAKLDAFRASMLEAGHGSWKGGVELYAVPTQDVLLNPMIDRFIVPATTMLLVVVALVLMIACTNLASFLLARAASRRREVAVRLALGASRGSLIRQLLTETLLLAFLGGGLGIALAVVMLRWLTTADLPLPVPITLDLTLDLRVLAFSLMLSLLAGLFFGLAPALQSSRADVVTTLKDESTGGGKRRRLTLRNVLVATQVAVSTLLLVGAGLFLRSLWATQSQDAGFGRRPTGMLNVYLPSTQYKPSEALRFYERLGERIEQIPGVIAVGWIDNPNLTATNQQTHEVNIDGVEPPEGLTGHPIEYARIDEGYFAASGVEITEGRGFERRDDADSPAVAIVSRAFVERFFPGQNPIGKSLRREGAPDMEIVGVASDTKVFSLGESPLPFLYVPIRQDLSTVAVVMAATAGSDHETAIAMLQAARELDPEIRVLESKTMARHLSTYLLPARASALFVGGFALLALVLAITGLYGLVSYSVAQRAREVGIRIAIGARPGEIIRLLMSGGLGLVLVGGAIGVALAALVSQGLSRLLYGVPPLDPVTFVSVPLLLLLVAVLASFVPAWRASRIDPARVMRVD